MKHQCPNDCRAFSASKYCSILLWELYDCSILLWDCLLEASCARLLQEAYLEASCARYLHCHPILSHVCNLQGTIISFGTACHVSCRFGSSAIGVDDCDWCDGRTCLIGLMAGPLLPRYVSTRRHMQPVPGIAVPCQMDQHLYTNGLQVCHETRDNGDCGVHDFSL